MSEIYCERAILHRGTRPSWEFAPSQRYGELVHIMRAGAACAIIADHKHGKPFWIGRLVDARAWVTVEDRIGAESIEFECGGRYLFPSRARATQWPTSAAPRPALARGTFPAR